MLSALFRKVKSSLGAPDPEEPALLDKQAFSPQFLESYRKSQGLLHNAWFPAEKNSSELAAELNFLDPLVLELRVHADCSVTLYGVNF